MTISRRLCLHWIFLLLSLVTVTAAKDSPKDKYLLFVGTYTQKESKGIYGFRFDAASSELTPLGVAAETTNPSFLAIDPSHRFLYAVNEVPKYKGGNSGAVSAFAINRQTGKLSLLNEVASRGADPCYIAFDKTGKFLMKWGRPTGGPEPGRGELNQPHSLAMDSKGRLFVGSRSCNCVQIFDQNGTLIDQWAQFSRPSGVFVDKNDVLYVADSESGPSNNTTHPGGWQRGIRIGSAVDGKVKYFIPDPDLLHTGTSSAEGLAVDARGTIYGAEVGQMAVKKYVRE